MSKVKIPKEIKSLAVDQGFKLTKPQFTLMKNFLGEIEVGKSRTQALYDLCKTDPSKIVALLYIVCKKEEKKLNLSEDVVNPKKKIDVDATISSIFNKM